MKIKFIGTGSAFNKEDGQSNILTTSNSGKNLLIDCGSYFWTQIQKTAPDLTHTDIDALYISHLHGDHIGGIEELAFCTYFNPQASRSKLFCNENLMHELWEESLKGGLESIQGKVVTLTEYFECFPVRPSDSFIWEDISFTPVQTVHVMAGYHIKYSYGLIMQEASNEYETVQVPQMDPSGQFLDGPFREVSRLKENPKVFITTDVQFCPNQILDFYEGASLIFQDCETAPYKSGVHASYSELETLPDHIKSKMWLYHYQPNPPQNPEESCFLGFVESGQEFEI